MNLRNCRAYMERFLKIRDKKGAIVPLKLNAPQEKLYGRVKDLRGQKIPVRVLVLKARQMGFSTVIEGVLFWAAVTVKNVVSLVVAHKEDATNNLFTMSKRFYDNLPQELKPMRKASNARELLFAAPTNAPEGTAGLDSSITVATAGGHGVGRSFTLKNAHLSEFAFWPGDKGETLNGIMQAVPDEADTMVFIESTANGFDQFKDLWDEAVAAWERGERDGWCPVFAAWWELSEYRRAVPPGFVPTEEEEKLKEAYHLDDEQLAWRRWCIKVNCSGDVKLFRQEYPSSPDEAFISSGSCIFDQEEIVLWRECLRKRGAPGSGGAGENPSVSSGAAAGSPRRGAKGGEEPIAEDAERESERGGARGRFGYDYDGLRITNIRWEDDTKGEILLLERPERGRPYVVGGDTAGDSGGAWSDYFVGQVLDNITGKQVAVLHGKYDEDVYARQMYCLGIYYERALLGVETNYSTHPVKELDRLGYPKLYVREVEDTYTGAVKKAYGFDTNTATRPTIIAELVAVARDSLELIQDYDTLGEMLSFAKNDKGKPEALPGKHDDLVMALAIAYHIRPQQRMTVLEQREVPRKRLVDTMKKKNARRIG